MEVAHWIEESFSSGDPEVRSWFLVRQSWLPFLLCGTYALLSSLIGPALMRYRQPMDLRWVMIPFNFSLVAFYTIELHSVLTKLPKVTWDMFCKGGVVKKGDTTYELAMSAWVLYVVKYVEFGDTLFFVLRKKQNQITFLHVVHHTVAPILGWIMLRTEKSGFQSIPVLLNSFVHVIMYSYYGLSAMGPHVRKYLWWKKYLTQLQMIQFILVVVFVLVAAPMSGCTMVRWSYFMDTFLAPLFFYLFYRFYRSAFKQNAKEHAK